jgi:hypothetical protein
VFAELLAFPGRTETFLNAFFRDTGITIDWHVSKAVWRAAGRAFGSSRLAAGGKEDPFLAGFWRIF